MTPDEIYALSDLELYEELKLHNISCGPVTGTTRSVYENRLKKFFKSDSPDKKKSPYELLRRSNEIRPTKRSPTIDNISPIRPIHLEKKLEPKQAAIQTDFEKPPVVQKSMGTNTESQTKHIPKIYPQLIMRDDIPKNLGPTLRSPAREKFHQYNTRSTEKLNEPFFRSPLNEQWNTRKINFNSYSHENFNGYHPRTQFNFQEQSYPSRPLLNLAGTVSKDVCMEKQIYNAQPPPQPSYTPKRTEHKNRNSYLTFIVAIIGLFFLIYVFFYTPNENPITTY